VVTGLQVRHRFPDFLDDAGAFVARTPAVGTAGRTASPAGRYDTPAGGDLDDDFVFRGGFRSTDSTLSGSL